MIGNGGDTNCAAIDIEVRPESDAQGHIPTSCGSITQKFARSSITARYERMKRWRAWDAEAGQEAGQ